MAWNGSNGASAPAAPAKKPVAPWHGVVALVAIVLFGSAAYFLISQPATKPAKPVANELEKATIEEVKPEIAEKAVEETKPEPKKVVPPKPRGPNLRDPKLSEEKRLDLYEKTLKEKEIPPETTNRVFRTGLEQVMSWVFTTEVGDMPPPLPPMSDFDFVHLKEILEMENPVRETDNDRAAYAKETVDYAKKVFKEFLEKGGEPEDFLPYYHSELQEAYAIRKQAQDSVNKIIAEAPELTGDYIKRVNESLAEKGIKGVVVPVRTLLKMGYHPEDVGCEMPNK